MYYIGIYPIWLRKLENAYSLECPNEDFTGIFFYLQTLGFIFYPLNIILNVKINTRIIFIANFSYEVYLFGRLNKNN